MDAHNGAPPAGTRILALPDWTDALEWLPIPCCFLEIAAHLPLPALQIMLVFLARPSALGAISAGGWVQPGQALLASLAGCSLSSVAYATGLLAEIGMLHAEPAGRTYRYAVRWDNLAEIRPEHIEKALRRKGARR